MILILGGGLSGSLLAYKLNQLFPTPEFLLIESRATFSNQHTWSFHHTDLAESSYEWITPLISHSWDRQDVHFPELSRTLDVGYHSIRSYEFSEKMVSTLKNRILLGDTVTEISSEGRVTLASGKSFQASIIFDARGLKSSLIPASGYQKFLGLDIELTNQHELEHPIIMDARCTQGEGFKFFYLLPWSRQSLLIEATCYSNDSEFNSEQYQNEIEQYCTDRSWKIKQVLRTEQAALPIPFRRDLIQNDHPKIIRIGMLGGYFHYTTGYSLPLAVKVSEVIAQTVQQTNWDIEHIQKALSLVSKPIHKQALFFSTLNRMLFLACKPENRTQIFSRFYHFNSGLISRFYRGSLTGMDQLRILIGKPPVPLFAGLKHALDSKTTQCSWERSLK